MNWGDLLFTGGYLALGALLGLAMLPVRALRTDEGDAMHVLAWSFFWPYLVLFFARFGLNRYVACWRRHLDRRRVAAYEARTRRAQDSTWGP